MKDDATRNKNGRSFGKFKKKKKSSRKKKASLWKNLNKRFAARKQEQTNNEIAKDPLQLTSWNKIGSSDLSYSDSTSLQTYPWRNMSFQLNSNHSLKQIRSKTVKSLKYIASSVVASNAEYLDHSHLSAGNWSIWSEVWNQILRLHKDSPNLFKLFASRFCEESKFKCHCVSDNLRYLGYDSEERLQFSRNFALANEIIPQFKKHRLETFANNVYLYELVNYIQGLSFNPLIILNFSNSDYSGYSKDDLTKLLRLVNLTALDMSNCDLVDSNFIYNLSVAIKYGRLPNLTIVRLTNCINLKPDGLLPLLNIVQDNNLSYLETDLDMETAGLLEGVFWKVPENDTLSRLTVGRKLYGLHKHENTTGLTSLDLDTKVILDIYVSGINLDSSSTENSMLDTLGKVWESRVKTQRKTYYSYIIDREALRTTMKTEGGTGAIKHEASKKRSTPKLKKTNATSFFGV